MTGIDHIGWGGRIETVPDDFGLGRGAYRDVPAYGVRRAIWDAAFGYVNGFKKRSILYYVLTRSLSRRVSRLAMRREGVPYWDKYENVPFVRTSPDADPWCEEHQRTEYGGPCPPRPSI